MFHKKTFSSYGPHQKILHFSLCETYKEHFHPYFTLKAFKSQEDFALYFNYCRALFMKIQKNTPFLTKVDQPSKTNQSEGQKIKVKSVNFFKKICGVAREARIVSGL